MIISTSYQLWIRINVGIIRNYPSSYSGDLPSYIIMCIINRWGVPIGLSGNWRLNSERIRPAPRNYDWDNPCWDFKGSRKCSVLEIIYWADGAQEESYIGPTCMNYLLRTLVQISATRQKVPIGFPISLGRYLYGQRATASYSISFSLIRMLVTYLRTYSCTVRRSATFHTRRLFTENWNIFQIRVVSTPSGKPRNRGLLFWWTQRETRFRNCSSL